MLLDFEDEQVEEEFGTYEPEEPEGLKLPRESDLFLGHSSQEKEVLELINSGAMPHALILSGPEGVGKATFAFRLARYLLKYGMPDSAQDSLFGDAPAQATSLDVSADDPVFAKVASGGHPDLLTIERQTDPKTGTTKNNLDVETARKAAPFLRMTSSADGGWRVVIVDDADLMNRNAQNALLKILEEPPANSILMLVTHRLGAMIPTIRSRCRALHFHALETDILAQLLEREVGQTLSLDDRDLLSSLTSGSIGTARQIIESDGLELVRHLMNMWQDWPKMNWVEIHHLSNQLARGKSADSMFDNIEMFFLWLTRSMVFAKAKSQLLPAPLQSHPVFQNMLDASDLIQWTQKFDEIREHFTRARRSNLDKKEAVLEAFMLMDK
ncbi:MAG: DNA polymerase III subunit delta' [Alphaproteobacteria bacterium]|nr:DNA polymerase III subunit delta' [Alphaproteobacteria bacterium]